MSDWKAWFKKYRRAIIWGPISGWEKDSVPINDERNSIILEDLYQAFKARMEAEMLEEHRIMSLLMRDNGVRPETIIRNPAEESKT